jgi:NADPH:quinone reductase
MLAVRVHEPGGADALRVETLPVPEPAAGEALIRVEVAGVNFIEIYQRSGQYPVPLPITLGGEGAGVVVATGADVADVQPGARVAWAGGFGSYAEYAAVAAAKLVPLPHDVSAASAAAVMLQGMTAHYLATASYPLRPGDHCLVHAAAGGVGLLLVQIAKRRGAFVIGTAGSAAKAQLAREAGADEVIVYTEQDFAPAVRTLTDGRGVNVVYDSVGRSTFADGLGVLAPRGTMVLFGQSSGPVPPLDPQLLARRGSLFLTRPTLGHYTATRTELLGRATDLFAWMRAGQLNVRIAGEHALADVASAHRALESRRTSGKLLLRVAG